MIDSTVVEPYLWAILVATASAPFLHEGSHYFVGWVANTDPSLQTAFFVIPNGVTHGEIETMDSAVIRFAGFAPFLWIPVWVVATVSFILEDTPESCLIMLIPFFTIFMSTVSDAVAFRNPEEYRRRAMKDGFEADSLFLPFWPFRS